MQRARGNELNDSELWMAVLTRVRALVSPKEYDTWFTKLGFKRDGDRAVVVVPNRFFADWIDDNYRHLLDHAVAKTLGDGASLAFEVLDTPPLTAPARSGKLSPSRLPDSLSPRYSFDSFVVGPCNELAHAACRAVAERPGEQYNPLFLYGGAGLGKTHLISSVGNWVVQHFPTMRVVFGSSEAFTNELIKAVRFDGITAFQEKYREVDCLLLDDIQFLAGRERTQEEFFHTFNALYDTGKQIVVTSDQFPRDIKGLERRLRSRFEWGLIADLQPPDEETKVAILTAKAGGRGITLSRKVAFFLARQPNSSVREIEGYLNRIIAVSQLQEVEVTLDMAQRVLGPLLANRRLSVKQVIKATADHFGIKTGDLLSSKKSREVSHPRQLAMFLARRHTNASFPEIGLAFGGKDHSTAVHAVKRVEALLRNSSEVRGQVQAVEKLLFDAREVGDAWLSDGGINDFGRATR